MGHCHVKDFLLFYLFLLHSKDTISKLEGQVVDLKQIISKLTRNNGELLEIVSEKISYEDKIKQLQLEKSQVIEKMKFICRTTSICP